MNILIVSGGTRPSQKLLKKYSEISDYIIAADSGAEALLEDGIPIDLLLGDFDSIDSENLKRVNSGEIRTYKRQKDFSDTEAAVTEALLLKPQNVYMLGATGTRMDHFISNLALLKKLTENGVHGEIIDSHNRIYMTDKSTEIEKDDGFISFSSAGEDVEGFTIKGFLYPLKDHTLKFGESLTVSNEFDKEPGKAEVIFKEGTVIIMHSRD